MKLAQLAPMATAVAMSAAMLWLAGDPFRPLPGASTALPPLRLLEPAGNVDAFPRRFSWEEIPGAVEYEITVGDEDRRTTLFRQRGRVAGLDLDFAEGAEPPGGRYVWEVVALGDSLALARGVGRFEVGSK